MRTVSLTVSPETASGVLHPDSPDWAPFYHSVRSGNRLQWTLEETGGASLVVVAPGYQTIQTRALLPPGSQELPWGDPGAEQAVPMDLLAEAPALSRPIAQGHQFFRAGEPWPWRMMTGFCDYLKFLRGESLEDVLSQAHELGSTGRRVLLQMHYIVRFYPREWPDFYSRLAEFIALENRYGQIPELVIYADEQVITSGRSHFDQVCAAVRDLPCVVELANEYSKNGVDPLGFPRFVDGLTFSRGSDVQEAPIVQPPGNYATFRERRDLLKAIGRGYKAQEACWDFGFDVPFVFNEILGAGEVDQPGRRSSDPKVFRAIAAQYAAAGASATFHAESLLLSQPLAGRQLDCARAFFEVV